MTQEEDQKPRSQPTAGTVFMWLVTAPVIVGAALLILGQPNLFLHPRQSSFVDLLFWALVLAVVGLLPVSVSKRLELTLTFPILLALAMLFDPRVTAVVTLVGAFDSREIRGEISLLKSAFNRSQIAIAALAGSAVFHSVASPLSPLPRLVPGALASIVVTYAVNVTLVVLAMRLLYGLPLRTVMGQLRLGALTDFFVNYVGLGFVGVVIVELSKSDLGLWSVAAFVLPLVFARQMFYRTLALEEASKELKDRERVMRALSNRMAEERQDERMQIAAYLHDDLAQMLFRLTLQVEMAKKRLVQGETEAVLKDLDGISATKQETSDAVRALIRDLHRSPIGRKGLAEAIQSFAEDTSRGHPTRIETDIVEVSLPPPIQLLIYQISREATMNALKHAEASTISISLEEIEDGVKLQITDDGKGFDTSAPPPEGHFGSVMMRERAMVAGGTYSIASEIGSGTKIAVTFPRVWVEEGTRFEADAETGEGSGRPTSARPPVGSTAGPPRAAASRSGADRDRGEGAAATDANDREQGTESGHTAAAAAVTGAEERARPRDGSTWPDHERPAVPA